jgi:Co/Zn/Cd efflux system component
MAVLIGLVGIAYTVTGFYLLAHQHDHHSDLSPSNRWFFSHLKSDLAGLFLGLLTALVINPDFWRFTRRPHWPGSLGAWLESLIKP